jgi:hypothetical protein
MSAGPSPRLAAVVVPARGGPRLAAALDALAWADVRAVLCATEAGGQGSLPGDAVPLPSKGHLRELAADWLLIVGEEERVAPGDAPALRAAMGAARPGEVLALPVVMAALDMRVRLARPLARLARRDTPLRVRPGFDLEFVGDPRLRRTLDVPLVRSRGATLTDAVELAGADAATYALLVDAEADGRGRGILWHPLAAAARALVARAGSRLGVGRWILAVLEGYRVVIAYAKLWERRRDRPVSLR